jgi:hypothetical protein
MLWLITTAAIGAGTVLFQLGVLSVWVTVMSLALRLLVLSAITVLIALAIRHAWRSRVR